MKHGYYTRLYPTRAITAVVKIAFPITATFAGTLVVALQFLRVPLSVPDTLYAHCLDHWLQAGACTGLYRFVLI